VLKCSVKVVSRPPNGVAAAQAAYAEIADGVSKEVEGMNDRQMSSDSGIVCSAADIECAVLRHVAAKR